MRSFSEWLGGLRLPFGMGGAANRADVAERALDRVIGERDQARAAAARAEQMHAALEPFATHGLNPDEPGVDLLIGLMRDRIVDWFGPSDFAAARDAYQEAADA